MPSKIFSAALVGLDAQIIEIETDCSYGLHSFTIVGLPDKAVEESKERIESAIKSTKLSPPHHHPLRVLVNLAPADLKKEGSLYDLPIAFGFLSASNQTKFNPQGKILAGELALDGTLRPIKGALPIAMKAKEAGFSEIILPKESAPEAALIKGLKIIGVASLKETLDYLEGRKEIAPLEISVEEFLANPNYPISLDWVKGQEYAKRALEITAAGSHNLLMQGPPGAGKTLLAKAIPSILPPFNFEESLEVTKIYSVAGLLPKEKPLMDRRPFRSPHHTSSQTAIVGGGNPPRPGEITLAHRGVLFLDEFPEFHRDVLEALRQPIEEGEITVLRSKYTMNMPARFTLVAAANPCPCGYLNDPEKRCTCVPSQVAMYKRKLSGPLMDRIDLLIDVPALKYEKLVSTEMENQSSAIQERVNKTRKIQEERFKSEKIFVNAEMNSPQIERYCQLDLKSKDLMRKYVDSGKLSARGYHRILKVGRTIADLEGSDAISYNHLAEALLYRVKES